MINNTLTYEQLAKRVDFALGALRTERAGKVRGDGERAARTVTTGSCAYTQLQTHQFSIVYHLKYNLLQFVIYRL